MLKSLRHCPGDTVLPGIRPAVYFIPKSDIVVWPTLPTASPEEMGKLATYQGKFVLAADKKWLRIDLVAGKGQIEAESQGEKPARTFLNKVTLTHAGMSEEAAGFCRQANTEDLVYLVQQRDGKFRVLGNPMFETDTKPAYKSGEGVTGEAGTMLNVEVTDLCPAPFYVDEIDTEEGKFSGATGLPLG